MNMNIGKTKRYDRETRIRVRKFIRVLTQNGLDADQIAKRLESEGIRTPSGMTPDAKFVRYQARCKVFARPGRKAKPEQEQSEAKPPIESHRNRLALEILTNPELDDKKRIRILTELMA